MEDLLFKIICAVIVVVIVASFYRQGRNENRNEAYDRKQIATAAADIPNEMYVGPHYGNRAEIAACMDSTVDSNTRVDSNPK